MFRTQNPKCQIPSLRRSLLSQGAWAPSLLMLVAIGVPTGIAPTSALAQSPSHLDRCRADTHGVLSRYFRCLKRVDSLGELGKAAYDTTCRLKLEKRFDRMARRYARRGLSRSDCGLTTYDRDSHEAIARVASGRKLNTQSEGNLVAALEVCGDGTVYDGTSGACEARSAAAGQTYGYAMYLWFGGSPKDGNYVTGSGAQDLLFQNLAKSPAKNVKELYLDVWGQNEMTNNIYQATFRTALTKLLTTAKAKNISVQLLFGPKAPGWSSCPTSSAPPAAGCPVLDFMDEAISYLQGLQSDPNTASLVDVVTGIHFDVEYGHNVGFQSQWLFMLPTLRSKLDAASLGGVMLWAGTGLGDVTNAVPAAAPAQCQGDTSILACSSRFVDGYAPQNWRNFACQQTLRTAACDCNQKPTFPASTQCTGTSSAGGQVDRLLPFLNALKDSPRSSVLSDVHETSCSSDLSAQNKLSYCFLPTAYQADPVSYLTTQAGLETQAAVGLGYGAQLDKAAVAFQEWECFKRDFNVGQNTCPGPQ